MRPARSCGHKLQGGAATRAAFDVLLVQPRQCPASDRPRAGRDLALSSGAEAQSGALAVAHQPGAGRDGHQTIPGGAGRYCRNWSRNGRTTARSGMSSARPASSSTTSTRRSSISRRRSRSTRNDAESLYWIGAIRQKTGDNAAAQAAYARGGANPAADPAGGGQITGGFPGAGVVRAVRRQHADPNTSSRMPVTTPIRSLSWLAANATPLRSEKSTSLST